MSNLDKVNQLLAEEDSSSEDDEIANLTQGRTIESLIGKPMTNNRISAALPATKNLLAQSAAVIHNKASPF